MSNDQSHRSMSRTEFEKKSDKVSILFNNIQLGIDDLYIYLYCIFVQ